MGWKTSRADERAPAGSRFYPWGDGFDPSWCCTRASHPDRPHPPVVASYRVDASVYGVRGLGGNIQDWCADVFHREGPARAGDSVVGIPTDVAREGTTARVRRGGFWFGTARDARSAYRSRREPEYRDGGLGFRAVYRPGPSDPVQGRQHG